MAGDVALGDVGAGAGLGMHPWLWQRSYRPSCRCAAPTALSVHSRNGNRDRDGNSAARSPSCSHPPWASQDWCSRGCTACSSCPLPISASWKETPSIAPVGSAGCSCGRTGAVLSWATSRCSAGRAACLLPWTATPCTTVVCGTGRSDPNRVPALSPLRVGTVWEKLISPRQSPPPPALSTPMWCCAKGTASTSPATSGASHQPPGSGCSLTWDQSHLSPRQGLGHGGDLPGAPSPCSIPSVQDVLTPSRCSLQLSEWELVLEINNISSSLNHKDLTCRAENAVGLAEDSVMLNVTCKLPMGCGGGGARGGFGVACLGTYVWDHRQLCPHSPAGDPAPL